ncbi:MAG TPA: IS1380 family transposase [Micropruina sp.]|nr:IS1380 family transposase [Micropruina sp.]
MQLSHTPGRMFAAFDEPNLVGSAGLVPALALTGRIGLVELADAALTVPGSKGCAGAKLVSVLAGMLAGADSIDDLDVLRHGAMGKLFGGVRAPSTLGSFLRSFRFGHVRQLDAVAARTLGRLAARVPGLLPVGPTVWLDVDDTIKPVYGRSKQGAEHGYTHIRGLNAQIATVSGIEVAPVIVAARLRRGAASSAHGAVRLVRDALATLRRANVTDPVLVRADSAYYQQPLVAAIITAGCQFSIGARLDKAVRARISTIEEQAWTPIVYPNAIVDPDTAELISCAEVAEVDYTAFTSHGASKQVTARLIVRRVPERNTKKLAAAAQSGLFPLWRYHAVFTNQTSPLVEAEKTHRGHAVIEQVFADLKAGPLAHLPSKSFNANAAWLAIATLAFNLTRALGITAGDRYARAETATIRAQLIHTPARIATSARQILLHLPTRWPWATNWQQLWTTIMRT